MEEISYEDGIQEFEKVLTCEINRFGYVVVGGNVSVPIGYKTPSLRDATDIVSFPQMFMVVGESSREEFNEHLNYLWPQFPNLVQQPRPHKFYYRVVTD